MAGVQIRDLAVSFGSVNVLHGIDLDISPGEFVVLLGPSGCGKSTLLNAVAGLLDVSDGQIFIGDRNVTWSEPKDRGIGMVFQSYALYPRMTVEGNLSFGLKVARLPREEIRRRVASAAELLQIEPLLKRRPYELSGGQRQRVAIGRALVRDVHVFLFDEPLSNLDAKLRTELRVEIKRLHKKLGGATMIYVTHDQVEALTLADRIAVMHAGVIQQLDTPHVIYHRPSNRFVAGFVGSPAMNFFTGRIALGGGQPWFESAEFRLPLAGYDFLAAPGEGRRAELGVRPEHIKTSEADASHRGAVEVVDPMGAETVAWTRFAGELVAIRMEGDARIASGQELPLHFPIGCLNLFDAETGNRL
jgi:multiple sugar transport system ATP-binding protein